MKPLKSNVEFRPVTYLENETDWMWQKEASKLAPWFHGRGADIGCGLRSIYRDTTRVDADKNVRPDVLCIGDILPFGDGELDYICSIHSFEHFDNQEKTLKEWLRCIKVGGIIGIVHPDVDFTKKQEERESNDSLKNNPFNKHFFEKNHAEFIEYIEALQHFGFTVIDHGEACPAWSFYVILLRNK